MGRTELVQIRMSPAEKALVVERAAGLGQTASEYLRGLGLGHAAPKKNRGAAELEREGAGLERTLGSGSAAPAVLGSPSSGAGSGAGSAGGSVPVFRCPWDSCEFRARSPKVTCPAHGRKVIPA